MESTNMLRSILGTRILVRLILILFLGACIAATDEDDSVSVMAEYSLLGPLQNTKYGLKGILQLSIPSGDVYGVDIQSLNLEILFESDDYVRMRITDAEKTRWEVPQDIVPRPFMVEARPESERNYDITYTQAPFSIDITRKKDGRHLFKSSSNLVYKDQYISIRTEIDGDLKTYGLGESTRLNHALKNGETYTLWASDDYTASVADGESHGNLYSSYPHYMQVDEGVGTAYGVTFFNSNGMDVTLADDGSYIELTAIGGIIDLYVMVGPNPIDVVAELTSIIGKPAMMPYWSLGFHNCKWGYEDVNEVKDVVTNYSKAGIPLDTQWMDIDYMYEYKDFTLDPNNFAPDEMKEFVDKLHDNDQHFGILLDPCIKTLQGYPPYDSGMELGIFVHGIDNKPYLAQVWPGPCYFPDFFHPSAEKWWYDQLSVFHTDNIAFDGVWIDMNEISNFCNLDGKSQACQNAAPEGCPGEGQDVFDCCLICQNIDPSNTLDYPPYAISNNMGEISSGTLPMSASHYGNISVYNAHNLYGLTEHMATVNAMSDVRRKRPFVLTRSSFLGVGRIGAKWTGDNGATWDDLKSSIISIMDFNMVGIPMIGAEICGFNYNTTEELCARWIEVGAFYTFSRDHNRIDMIPQELYRWNSVASAGKFALNLRYRMLPYLYTLFYIAHSEGKPVIRPLWMTFPGDEEAHQIQTQFMWGDAVMISPVLEVNSTEVHAYFPQGVWYELATDSLAFDLSVGSYEDLDTPLTKANVHIYGGKILPLQAEGVMNTVESRASYYTLFVALDSSGYAAGTLYIDDGEQVELEDYINIGFDTTIESPTDGVLNSKLLDKKGTISQSSPFSTEVSTVIVLGRKDALSLPSTFTLNGKEYDVSTICVFDDSKGTLKFNLPQGVSLLEEFTLKWS